MGNCGVILYYMSATSVGGTVCIWREYFLRWGYSNAQPPWPAVLRPAQRPRTRHHMHFAQPETPLLRATSFLSAAGTGAGVGQSLVPEYAPKNKSKRFKKTKQVGHYTA